MTPLFETWLTFMRFTFLNLWEISKLFGVMFIVVFAATWLAHGSFYLVLHILGRKKKKEEEK